MIDESIDDDNYIIMRTAAGAASTLLNVTHATVLGQREGALKLIIYIQYGQLQYTPTVAIQA